MNEEVARKLAERLTSSVTAEEAEAYLRAPVTDEEREDVLEQVRWFTRRYTTPLQRLQYVTRATARWRRVSVGPVRAHREP